MARIEGDEDKWCGSGLLQPSKTPGCHISTGAPPLVCAVMVQYPQAWDTCGRSGK